MKKRNIVIEIEEGPTIEDKEIEMVERKGLGHPDTLCDLCSETASQALSLYYLKNFKTIFHHNLDKGLLIAGESQPKFGGGKVLKPIKIIVGGRATDKVENKEIPVKEIVKNAISKKLLKIVRCSKEVLEKNFILEIDYRPGAANLQEVFRKSKKVPLANDTSFGVGHAPLSLAELVTLKTAQLLNSSVFVKKFPFVGADIKVMTLRIKKEFFVTFSVAYIDKYIKSPKEYFFAKKKVKEEVEQYLKKILKTKQLKVFHNSLDSPNAKTENEIYLTCLGLSAEQGDDGQVGRGNRVSGLITPCREMSLEAAAGKNINHPGKLYQILSYILAQKISKIEGTKECTVKLLSQIGKPLDEPQVVSIKIKGKLTPAKIEKARKIVQETLDNLLKIQWEIAKGKYPVF